MNLNAFDYTPVTFLIDLEDRNLEFDLQEFVKYFQRFSSPTEDISHALAKFSSLFRAPFSYRSIMKAITYKGALSSKNLKIHSTYYRGANLWLLKPVDFNRGRGIELFNSLDGLKNLLNNGKLLGLTYWSISLLLSIVMKVHHQRSHIATDKNSSALFFRNILKVLCLLITENSIFVCGFWLIRIWIFIFSSKALFVW